MIRPILRSGWVAALLLAGTTWADTVSIGPDGINSVGLGTGSGVVIGQVEEGRPGDADEGDPPASRNTTTNPAGVFEQDGIDPPDSMEVTQHAQRVAGVMISTDATDGGGAEMNGIAPTGVATGASLYSSAYITEGTDPGYQHALLTLQYIATRPGMRAVNHSWGKPSEGGGVPFDGSSLLTLGFDWSVRQHNVLHIIAGNQGSMLPIPKDNYNGMTIGRSAKDANGVYRIVSGGNTYDEDAAGDRTSIALIAPGDDIELTGLGNAHAIANGSSYAAPHVTGTVALLQQNATSTNERRPQVMKAVLMNSADKIKDIMGMERTVEKRDGSKWFGSTADTDPNIPLDIEMGTGHLNANRAHRQFTEGEFPPGSVPDIGWDYFFQDDPFIPNKYTLSLEKDDFVSATLVWDREVLLDSPFSDYQSGDEFIDNGFANFDLYLVPAGGAIAQAVASSTSTAQNVEHIFAQVSEPGNYELQVWIGELNQVFYALAWWGRR